MGSRITVRPTTSVGVIGLIAIISGVVMAVVGVGAWVVVSQQLGSERITVADDAPFLSGARVADPFTAFAQAEVIRDHALDASDGRTYAELEQGDPTRAVVMNASFLRASLFTSVVAFGLSAFVTASGVLFILVGWALRRSAGGPLWSLTLILQAPSMSRTIGVEKLAVSLEHHQQPTAPWWGAKSKTPRMRRWLRAPAVTITKHLVWLGHQVALLVPPHRG